MGKSLLAFLDSNELERILTGYEFSQLTHRTIDNEEEFRNELVRVKNQGYSINDEELSVGLRSVAAPIKGVEGHAVAALNIAVPTKRVSREELENRLAPLVVDTGMKIQRALGSGKNS